MESSGVPFSLSLRLWEYHRHDRRIELPMHSHLFWQLNMAEAGAEEGDMEDIAAFLGQIEGVETSVTIRELEGGACKLSVRTSGGLNATKVCALLGGGGLVRAYSHGASIALKAAGIITMKECSLLMLSCDYSRYGRVSSLIPECGGIIDDTDFAGDVTLSFHMAPELMGSFARKLADATNGQVTFEECGSQYFVMEREE